MNKAIVIIFCASLLVSCNLTGRTNSRKTIKDRYKYVPTNSNPQKTSTVGIQPVDFVLPEGWYLPHVVPPPGSKTCAVMLGKFKPTKSVFGYVDSNYGVCSYTNGFGWDTNVAHFDKLLIEDRKFTLAYSTERYEMLGMTFWERSYFSSNNGDSVLLSYVEGSSYGYDYQNERYDKSLPDETYSIEIHIQK